MDNTEGITLKSIPYQDKSRIISVFTKEFGLISLLVKDIISDPSLFTLTSPFCVGEFIFKRGREELFLFQDGSIIDEHLDLRGDLKFINSAYAICISILDTQLYHKKSKLLYLLLKAYLRQIPLFKNPNALVSSFYLKLLFHEGLLNLKEDKVNFSLIETPILEKLAHAKKFDDLNFDVDDPFKEKIKYFFDARRGI